MANEKSGQKSVIIVGAGAGGVATAARLAKAGFRVTVYEKNGYTGGRCSLIHHEGYRFDQGPSLLLLPEMFQSTFKDLGTSLEAEGVEIMQCHPNYEVWFHDGECFHLSSSLPAMKREIERWEGTDGFSRYLDFMRESHAHYELSVQHVLRKNFDSWFSLLRWDFLRHVLSLHPFESIYSRASRYFLTERLRRVFTFGSMYMGMSPFDAPGTYSLLQYTELAEGIWYPKGGFHTVMEALVNVGKRYGVDYKLSTPIQNVLLSADNKTATGITLPNGESHTADIVICNADLVYAYNNLLPKSSYAQSLSRRPGSCSSFSFYWSLDTTLPALKTHNVFLAEQYRESFDSIFKDQTLPDQPSFYLNVPSRVDPSAAPAGKDAVVVLCPVGHLMSAAEGKGLNPQNDQDWDRLINKARSAILRTVEERTGVPLAKHIVHEILNTPQSWKEEFNLDKGAILGLSHSFFNVLSFRPRTRHDGIKNMYFVGASTHPGTGVPIVLAGSRITAEQVLSDHGVAKPWTEWTTANFSNGGTIDEPHVRPVLSWFHIAILVLLGLSLSGFVLM